MFCSVSLTQQPVIVMKSLLIIFVSQYNNNDIINFLIFVCIFNYSDTSYEILTILKNNTHIICLCSSFFYSISSFLRMKLCNEQLIDSTQCRGLHLPILSIAVP